MLQVYRRKFSDETYLFMIDIAGVALTFQQFCISDKCRKSFFGKKVKKNTETNIYCTRDRVAAKYLFFLFLSWRSISSRMHRNFNSYKKTCFTIRVVGASPPKVVCLVTVSFSPFKLNVIFLRAHCTVQKLLL